MLGSTRGLPSLRTRWLVAKTIEEAVEQLKRDPTQPVRASVGGLTIEVRAVPEPAGDTSAAEVFAGLGPWAGETTEQILELLAAARRQGGQRSVSDL
jgi:hypothetical protein